MDYSKNTISQDTDYNHVVIVENKPIKKVGYTKSNIIEGEKTQEFKYVISKF